jgi:predicted nucleotidyltransferase
MNKVQTVHHLAGIIRDSNLVPDVGIIQSEKLARFLYLNGYRYKSIIKEPIFTESDLRAIDMANRIEESYEKDT